MKFTYTIEQMTNLQFRVTENERWPFFTNMVERAGLSEDCCQQLRKSVEEGCAAKHRSQRAKKRPWMKMGDIW